MVEQLCFSRYF